MSRSSSSSTSSASSASSSTGSVAGTDVSASVPPPVGGSPVSSSKHRGKPHRRSKTPSMPGQVFPTTTATKNVDYFSHQWDELDLKASWSVMTKHKRTLVDGIRLENASWRKWIQKKFNLRKVSPESLRWKKDEDITWLYGPFCEAVSHDINAAGPASRTRHRRSIDGPLMSVSTPPDSDTSYTRDDQLSPVFDPIGTAAAQLPAISPLKKPALKKGNRSLVTDFKRFATETDKILKRTIGSPTTGSSSHVDRLDTESPIREGSGSSGAGSLHTSASDSELNAQEQFLNTEERALLRYMNQGPGTEPMLTTVGTPGSESAPSAVESSQESVGSAKRSNRLRFSNKVEVVEFDRDARTSDSSETRAAFTVGSIPSTKEQKARQPIILPYYPPGPSRSTPSPPRRDIVEVSTTTTATATPTQAVEPEPEVPDNEPEDDEPEQVNNPNNGGWFGRVFQVAADVTTLISRYGASL